MASERMTRPLSVGHAVRSYLNLSPSEIIRVPEIERDSPEDAIRKLQVQIFALTDALADLAQEVDELRKR